MTRPTETDVENKLRMLFINRKSVTETKEFRKLVKGDYELKDYASSIMAAMMSILDVDIEDMSEDDYRDAIYTVMIFLQSFRTSYVGPSND